MSKSKQVAKTITTDEEIWEFFQKEADRDERSLTYVVKAALLNHIKKHDATAK